MHPASVLESTGRAEIGTPTSTAPVRFYCNKCLRVTCIQPNTIQGRYLVRSILIQDAEIKSTYSI